MRRLLIAVVVVAGATGLFWRGVTAHQAANQRPNSDRDLTLGKTTLVDPQLPAPFIFTDESPGDSTLLPRSYDGAPPLVPHSLDGLVPIAREENLCLFCHAIGSTDPGDPPQVPRSHFIDWRVAPDVVRDTVAGARWTCTTCHVRQSDAPTPVGNTFGSAVKE